MKNGNTSVKKILSILLCLGFILALGFFYYQYYQKDNINLSSFVPEDTLLYVKQKDLGKLTDDFNKNSLAEAIQSIDYIKLALDLDVSYYTVEKLRSVLEFADSEIFSLIFNELFSKNFSFALLSGTKKDGIETYFNSNILLLCTPKHRSNLLEVTLPLLDNDLTVISNHYGKYVIKRIEISEKLKISIAKIGPKYLIALDRRTLRKALDRYDEKKTNLSENFFFHELEEKYKTANLFTFLSLKKMYMQAELYLKDKPGDNENLRNQLRNWRGFTAAGYGSWRKNDVSRNLLSLYFNNLEIPTNTSNILGIQPEENSVISFVPNDTLFYYWTNTFDLPTLWSIYENESSMPPAAIKDLKESMQDVTDLSFDDLVSLPGNSFHIIARRPSPVDLLPVPNFSLIVDLENIRKTKWVLNNFFFKNDIPHGRDIYKGVYFTYWGDGMQRGLQPVYAFYENLLILSSSVKMHISIIDAILKKNGLITKEKFLKIGKPLLLKNNSMAIIELSELLQVLKELIRWSGTIMAIQNQETAKKSKILIDDLILPLLDGLKMYPNIVTRSYNSEGLLSIESNTIISH